MPEKDTLVALKYSEIFESIQKENQVIRKVKAEEFSQMGMLDSGSFAMAINNLELGCIRKLLDGYLQILIDVFYKNSKPWTNKDEIFLVNKIDELFNARSKVSRKSLEDYFEHRSLRLPMDHFDREAAIIQSTIKRKIRIKILENRISYPELQDRNIEELLGMDEDNTLEFKSTFQWDIEKRCMDKKLRLETIKTIAAFSNTDGGYLLIGVGDKKEIVGLEEDYSLLSKSNRDGFSLLLTQEIENRISRDFATKVGVSYHPKNSKDICMIKIIMGDDAIWVKDGSKEIFYIRTNNSTRQLSPRDSTDYIRRKWRPKE